MEEREKQNIPAIVDSIYWRDEILQVMYWMTGEGLGREFTLGDLQRFLQADEPTLLENLDVMVRDNLIESIEERYTLTALGQKEGGRRFADEFEEMLKPGHFECDEPDCDFYRYDTRIARNESAQ